MSNLKNGLSWHSKFFIWMAGADDDKLANCPKWERRKYEAFGATVLVPTMFGTIACAYAVSTLTSDWRIILPVSLVWAFIILSIDRALLSSYRAFVKGPKKVTQFGLRFLVAVLMGVSISHPLTLLLFKDTIAERIELRRDQEVVQIRESARAERKAVDEKITAALGTLADQRKLYEQTMGAGIVLDEKKEVSQTAAPSTVTDAFVVEQIEQATQAQRKREQELAGEIASLTEQRDKVQEEVAHWQAQYEQEIGGERSGVAGVGPRAKSIRTDQLDPRRQELERLTRMLSTLGIQQNQLASEIAATEQRIRAEHVEAGAEEAAKARQEEAELASLQRQLQKQRAATFLSKQDDLLAQVESQIQSTSDDVDRLRAESAALSASEQRRIDKVADRRMDLLTQSIVLHEDLFHESAMALGVWLILAALFMLIDTIPLVVKFFSKPGLYDIIIEVEEQTIGSMRVALENGEVEKLEELAMGGGKTLDAFRSLEDKIVASRRNVDLKLEERPMQEDVGSLAATASEVEPQSTEEDEDAEVEGIRLETGKVVPLQLNQPPSKIRQTSTPPPNERPASPKLAKIGEQLAPSPSPAKAGKATPGGISPNLFQNYRGQNLPPENRDEKPSDPEAQKEKA